MKEWHPCLSNTSGPGITAFLIDVVHSVQRLGIIYSSRSAAISCICGWKVFIRWHNLSSTGMGIVCKKTNVLFSCNRGKPAKFTVGAIKLGSTALAEPSYQCKCVNTETLADNFFQEDHVIKWTGGSLFSNVHFHCGKAICCVCNLFVLMESRWTFGQN